MTHLLPAHAGMGPNAGSVDGDHMVPLAEAGDGVVSKWDAKRREVYVNDLDADRAPVAVAAKHRRSGRTSWARGWLLGGEGGCADRALSPRAEVLVQVAIPLPRRQSVRRPPSHPDCVLTPPVTAGVAWEDIHLVGVPMYGDAYETSIGDRIGRLRDRRSMTQEELAEAACVSVDTVRKLEQNRRLTARMSTLNQLASALDVDVSVLVGTPTTFETRADGDAPSVLALRQAVSPVSDLLGEDDDPEEPPSVGALREALRSTEQTRREGRMGAIGATLPQLIRDARAAVRHHTGADQQVAYAVLAEAYQVAATTLTALRKEDAAFTAMERSTLAARHSNDPHLEAIGASTLAWIFTKQGRLEDARRVALAHANANEPGFRSAPIDLSLWGILLLRAATATVRQGATQYDRVDELLRMATGAAASIGSDRMDYATPFGPTNTGVAKVNFLVEMEKNDEAVTAARIVPGLGGLPPTWRARFHVDRALAHADMGQDGRAVRALLKAEDDAAEWMRYHGTARRLVVELRGRERHRSSPVTDLANRLHLDG